jgi:ribosomal protein L24
MVEQDTEIKVGDKVRARAGAHEGKVGTALRVVETRDLELSSDKVLVIFNAGEADYLNADALEKAEKGEE